MSSKKVYREGLLGKKVGMTHFFDGEGKVVPVTIIQTGPCYVLDVKDSSKHGYSGVRLGFVPKKAQRVNKPDMGGFAAVEKGAFQYVREVRCDAQKLGWTTPGQEIVVTDVFTNGEMVDVSGYSIGKGFQGVVRRHGMKGQPATRGTHEYRRHVGAIGCRKFPGHIFKNKRMPGHMGANLVTVQNLEVVGVRAEDNLLFVKGGIPGSEGGLVVIRKAIKGFVSEMKSAA